MKNDETVENEFWFDENDEVPFVIDDEKVETQSRMFIDLFWMQEIFGINA